MNIPLSPYIRRAWYNILQPDENIQERVIFDYELLYVKAGKALVTIEDQQYTGVKGDIFIFRPHQRHSISVAFREPLIQPHIHFDLTYSQDREEVPVSYRDTDMIMPEEQKFFREDILDRFISPFPQHLHLFNPMYIEQMFFDVIHTYSYPSLFNDIELSYLFLKLWKHILSEMTYQKGIAEPHEDISAKMKFFIDQNLSRSISLDEIVEMTHYSRSYISRVFHDSYGISPLKYHTLLRIQKAKSMIQYTNMSISEISDTLGFDSLQDFSRVFKKNDGNSPSSYRKTFPEALSSSK